MSILRLASPAAPTAADERATLDDTLRAARLAAYPPGEFVGQESFLCASQVRRLAIRAGITDRATVLDLCCGVAGPGRLVAREFGCGYLGVDASEAAVAIARERAGAACRFLVARVPPVPAGPFDVVLLLETMLAFPDKRTLLAGVAAALPPGGRFAFTVEEGLPLNTSERALMPAADTVWPVPERELRACLADVGLRVRWSQDWTAPHQATARALLDAFRAEAPRIRGRLGAAASDDLLTAHALWSDWLRRRRVRKLALVATKTAV